MNPPNTADNFKYATSRLALDIEHCNTLHKIGPLSRPSKWIERRVFGSENVES